ncbi:MAG: DUF4139 domain-containing protein [Bacteroidia bacterium]
MKTTKPIKQIIVAGTLLLSSMFSIAAEKNVNSKITQANVFLNGAQLFHSANVQLPAGNTTVYIEGISPYLNPQSLQAGGKGDFIILDVEHYIHYPEPVNEEENSLPIHIKREIKLLEDSILNLSYDIELLSDKKNLLLTEKNIINNNKLYKGEGKSDSLQLFASAIEFYHKKLNEINNELLKLKKEENQLQEKKNRQQNRLYELKNYSNTQQKKSNSNQPVHKIKVNVMADAPVTATILLNYFISNAGWNPHYDIRATNTENPVKLTYKAQVYQQSGLDWNGIKLVLSTSNPQKNNHKPNLNPWYLSFYNPNRYYNYDKRGKVAEQIPTTVAREEQSKSEDDYSSMDALTIADYTSVKEALVNIQYDVKIPCSIPADGKQHSITVLQKEINTSYEYRAVPKLDSDAFIMARITGWDDLNLMSAKANIYFENMYVGETFINADETKDTLDIALGRDNSIQISRKRLKNFEKEKFLNDQKVLTYAYEITVRNGKNSNIRLVVEDQIPISNNQQIKVELTDNGKAEVNEHTGMLTWDLKLKAKENKTIKYSFEIKHDKDKQLSILP